MQRFKLVTDNDGHDYIIHVEDETAFYAWVESTEGWDSETYTGKDFEGCRVSINRLTFTDPQGWQ